MAMQIVLDRFLNPLLENDNMLYALKDFVAVLYSSLNENVCLDNEIKNHRRSSKIYVYARQWKKS